MIEGRLRTSAPESIREGVRAQADGRAGHILSPYS